MENRFSVKLASDFQIYSVLRTMALEHFRRRYVAVGIVRQMIAE